MKEKVEPNSNKKRGSRADAAAAAEEAVQGQNEIVTQDLRPVTDSEQRHERIARLAYQRAQARDFAPGGELEDWLLAEREVDAEMPRGP